MFVVVKASAWDANNPESVREYVGYVASKEGISVSLVNAIVKAESGFNKDATNSKSTASGLWQYLNGTFKSYCIEKYGMAEDLSQKNNPFIQTNCAIEMLKEPMGYAHWQPSQKYWGKHLSKV